MSESKLIDVLKFAAIRRYLAVPRVYCLRSSLHFRAWSDFSYVFSHVCKSSHISGVGNTHVTCHVGVSSCGQCHRNTFTALIIFYAIVNMIHKPPSPRLCRPRLGAFSFPHPPTPTPPPLICTQTQPGRGGLVEGGSSALSIGLRPVEQSTSSRLLPRPL